MPTAALKIGFVGLGNMGGPMAINIAKAAHSLVVYDLDPERCRKVAEHGAQIAPDIGTLVSTTDLIITSLPGPKQIRAVAEGPAGIVASLKPGAIWVDMTTNDPELVRDLAKLASGKGASFIDAPVTGAVDGARKGKLTIFAGGPAETFRQVLPVLESMGEKVFLCGPIGTGNIVKLVTNQLWFINAVAIGEGLVLGVRGGVEPLVLWNAIKASVGTSFVAEHDVPSIFAGHYDPSFTTDLCLKDLGLIQSMAAAVGVPLRLTTKAHEIFEDAKLQYGGMSAELHVVKLLEDSTRTSLRVQGDWTPPWEA